MVYHTPSLKPELAPVARLAIFFNKKPNSRAFKLVYWPANRYNSHPF